MKTCPNCKRGNLEPMVDDKFEGCYQCDFCDKIYSEEELILIER